MIPTRQRALLSSPTCLLTSAVFWLQNLVWKIAKKQTKKNPKRPSLKLVQRIGPETTLLQSLSFYLCFICLGKHCEGFSLLCTHHDSKAPPPSAPGCLFTARLSKRKPWTHLERCVSDTEASYTEQMGSAWDEETNLMSWLWGTTKWCKFWLCSEGRMNTSICYLCSEWRGSPCKQTETATARVTG